MKKFFSKLKKPQWLESSSSRQLQADEDILGRAADDRLNPATASDPAEWERGFGAKWRNTVQILDRKIYSPDHESNFDELVEVTANISNMYNFLLLEVNSQPEAAIGPILDQYFNEQILDRVIDWGLQLSPRLTTSCQISLLRMYENIVVGSHSPNHSILVHKPILKPLLRLLAWSRRIDPQSHIVENMGDKKEETPLETQLAQLLHQLCQKISTDRTLLLFFFNGSKGEEDFLIFSQLVSFIYKKGNCGQLARDAILTILSLTIDNPDVVAFIMTRSDFCSYIAAGLGGRVSELPTTILGDGGERLVEDEYAESLADYHSSLLFCNAVAQTAHKDIAEKMAEYFYSNFLGDVIKPILIQEDRHHVAATLAYLQFCVQTTTEAPLVKAISRMLLTNIDEKGVLVIERIIGYVKAGDKTSITAIALLNSLLQMGNEDLMLAVVFRPLLTDNPGNKKQFDKIYNRVRCSELAQKYLDCIPNCILKFKDIVSHPIFFRYLQESRVQMDARSDQCRSWKLKYDGSGNINLSSEQDDDANCPIPLSRVSSSRSSMSMAAHGVNRYSNSNHFSNEFYVDNICDLGRKLNVDEVEHNDDIGTNGSDEIVEDADFVLPAIDEMTSSKVMTTSNASYLHISGLDDQGESDDSIPVLSKVSTDTEMDVESSSSFVLTGWQEVKDESTFRTLLDKQKVAGDVLDGNSLVDFINSKFDGLKNEVDDEKTMKLEEITEKNTEKKKKIEKTGFSVYNFPVNSSLLKMIIDNVESFCDNSLPFNAELCGLISTLATYPQPILAYYLFDPKDDESQKCLLSILQSVQTRIEVLSDGLADFDLMVNRGIKSLSLRAGRLEKHTFSAASAQYRKKSSDSSRLSSSVPSRQPKTSFRFSRHTFENHGEGALKQTAVVAIFMTHLCQLLASIVLQQALIV